MKPLFLLLFFLSALSAFSAPRPQYHWPLDEESGVSSDELIRGNGGTIVGGVLLNQSARMGTGYSFPGGNSRVELSEDIVIPHYQDFAVSAWLNPAVLRSGSETNAAILLGNPDGGNYIRIESDSVYLKWSNVVASVATTAFTENEWQHFFLRRVEGEVEVFRNGVSLGTVMHPVTCEFSTLGAKHQENTFANHFVGLMDDVRVFVGCALSESDVWSLANIYDGRVSFSAMGCGPYNHPLGGDGKVTQVFSEKSAYWNGLVNQYPDPSYIDRDDTVLRAYVAREQFEEPRSEFLVHLGDLVTGQKGDWPEQRFEDLAGLLGVDPSTGLAVNQIPIFVVPGDNEWSDHDTVDIAWSYWTNHFLNFHTKFVDEGMQPSFPHPVGVQAEEPANFSFRIDDVLFLGINAIGGGFFRVSDWDERVEATGTWISRHLPANPAEPVHWWPLDETAPGTLLDVQGGNHAATNGVAIDQAGYRNRSVEFDGANDDLSLSSGVQIGSNENFTVTAWVNPDTLRADGGFINGAVIMGDAANLNWVRLNTNSVRVKANGSSLEFPLEESFETGVWQHFSLVRNGGELVVYRNGKPVGFSLGHKKDVDWDRIGSKGGTQFFDGRMDDVRIYDVALNRDELLALSGLQAHWPLDEMSAVDEVVDAWGANPASNFGAAVNASGVDGTSYDFSGAEHLRLEFPLEIAASNNFTLSAWVFPDVLTSGGPVSPSAVVFGDSGNDDYIRIEDDLIRVKGNGSIWDVSTSPSFVQGVWQHLVVTREGSVLKIYRDGELVGTSSPGHVVPFRFDRIGSKDELQFFDGKLDHLYVLARGYGELSPAEKQVLQGDRPRSAVLLAQATVTANDPTSFRKSIFPLRSPIQRGADRFRNAGGALQPILFLQADEHRWKEEAAYLGATNVKNVVINSIDSDHPTTQVVVTDALDPDQAFIFNRRGDPGVGVAYLDSHEWTGTTANACSYDVWAAIHFPHTTITNGVPSANPDGDARQNIEEYLSGSDPTISDATNHAWSVMSEEGNLIFRYPYLNPHVDVDVMTSTNLEAWVESHSTWLLEGSSTLLTIEPKDQNQKFYRLRFLY